MPGLASAPSRRVFVFLSDTTASTWTAKGQSLFDNAVFWATRTRYSITKKILHLNYNPTLTAQATCSCARTTNEAAKSSDGRVGGVVGCQVAETKKHCTGVWNGREKMARVVFGGVDAW